VDLPLALLIDAGTASAAEILAGTLQDNDRAVVVGRRSFGKALVQSPLPLPNGDVVWLTTARIATPSGRIIQRRYDGLHVSQYLERAGRGSESEDTSRVYRTKGGGAVRGGGGIRPDVPAPGPADLPRGACAGCRGLAVTLTPSARTGRGPCSIWSPSRSLP
jgi:carboxyl-terminal processing protease